MQPACNSLRLSKVPGIFDADGRRHAGIACHPLARVTLRHNSSVRVAAPVVSHHIDCATAILPEHAHVVDASKPRQLLCAYWLD